MGLFHNRLLHTPPCACTHGGCLPGYERSCQHRRSGQRCTQMHRGCTRCRWISAGFNKAREEPWRRGQAPAEQGERTPHVSHLSSALSPSSGRMPCMHCHHSCRPSSHCPGKFPNTPTPATDLPSRQHGRWEENKSHRFEVAAVRLVADRNLALVGVQVAAVHLQEGEAEEQEQEHVRLCTVQPLFMGHGRRPEWPSCCNCIMLHNAAAV